MTSKHRQHEDIAMLNDLLDYLNTHQMNNLLDKNTSKLTELETTPQENWSRGDKTIYRELVSIRQALLARLGLPSDRDHWLKGW